MTTPADRRLVKSGTGFSTAHGGLPVDCQAPELRFRPDALLRHRAARTPHHRMPGTSRRTRPSQERDAGFDHRSHRAARGLPAVTISGLCAMGRVKRSASADWSQLARPVQRVLLRSSMSPATMKKSAAEKLSTVDCRLSTVDFPSTSRSARSPQKRGGACRNEEVSSRQFKIKNSKLKIQ